MCSEQNHYSWPEKHHIILLIAIKKNHAALFEFRHVIAQHTVTRRLSSARLGTMTCIPDRIPDRPAAGGTSEHGRASAAAGGEDAKTAD